MAIISVLMRGDLVTAAPDDTVAEVAGRMADRNVGAVLVVRDAELVALFSERDLLKRVVAAGRDPAATRVIDVATRDVVSVEPGARIRQCAELLENKRIRHLPVVEAGRPVGIVSARDLFAAVASCLERFVDERRYQDELADGVDPYGHIGGGYGR